MIYMKYEIKNLKVDPFDKRDLFDIIKYLYKINNFKYKIIQKSIDARNKNNIFLIYHLLIETNENLKGKNVSIYENKEIKLSYPKWNKKYKPIIVGFGPAGMFSALYLARCNACPIIIERGSKIEDRKKFVEDFFKNKKLNPNSNIQFGEGGAGTFSDGKLTTNLKDPLIKFILNEFYLHGAKEDVIYESRPHVGTDYLEIVVKNKPGYSTSHIQDESGSWTYNFTSDMSKDDFLKEMFFNHVDVIKYGGGDWFFEYLRFANYLNSDGDIYTKYHGSYFSDEKHIGNNILNFQIDNENKKLNLKSKDDYNYSYKEKINFNSCSYSNGDDVYSLLEYGNVERKSLGTYPSDPENGEGEQCDYSFDYSCYRKEYGMLNNSETALYWYKYSKKPELYKDYLNLESGCEFYGKNTDNFNGISSNGDEYTYVDGYFHPGRFSLTYRDDYINPTSIESSLSDDDPYYIRKESEDGSYVELCGSRPMIMDVGLNAIYAGITCEKLNNDNFTSYQFFQPISYQSKIANISEHYFYNDLSSNANLKSIYDAAYDYMDLSYELTDKYIIVDIKNYFFEYLYSLVNYYLEVDSDYFIRNTDFAQSIISQIKSAKEKDNLYEHIKYYINYSSLYNESYEDSDGLSYEITSSPIIDYVLYEDNLKRDASGTYDEEHALKFEDYADEGYDLSELREHYSEKYTDCTYSNCRIEIVSDSIDADFYNSKADSIKQEVKEGCAGYKNLS